MYVFDTSPLSTLFKNYYRSRFPTLWSRFDELVTAGQVVSTREVLREVEDGAVESLRQWATNNKLLFATPTSTETAFVAKIYGVSQFQQNIELQKLLKGGRNADAFVIAKAATEGKKVVTMELLKPNAVKIPNICLHFSVPCLSLEDFMEEQGWTF